MKKSILLLVFLSLGACEKYTAPDWTKNPEYQACKNEGGFPIKSSWDYWTVTDCVFKGAEQ